MRRGRYHSDEPSGTAVGVDVGATLAKLALRPPGGELHYQLLPADDLARVAAAVSAANPARTGLTGGGAGALARLLSLDTGRVAEFEAWGEGATALLGADAPARYLLVSIGTGTSILLVDAGRVFRIGGTALGGGTLLGLGRRLIGVERFEDLCGLAARGDRRRVDLSVADIYRGETPPLAGELTASSFARLARPDGEGARREDLAHALVGMVGENVALIAGGLSAAANVDRIVFAGSPLRQNPALRDVIGEIARRFGRSFTFLEQGEFGGALGALLVSEREPSQLPAP